MTCKHGFPAPNEMTWSGPKPPRCLECEIERLCAAIKVEFETNESLRTKVVELEAKLKTAENAASILGDDVYNLTEKVIPNLQEKHKQRGERLKDMRKICFSANPKAAQMAKWFDEKGEPL